MTRIKICGITNIEDARAAMDYGADALGFILVPDSPRFVRPEAYEPIVKSLPPFITAVAVVRRVPPGEGAGALAAFDTIQSYEGDHADISAGAPRDIRAFPVKDAASLDLIAVYLQDHNPAALLLDTYHKDKLGGSGETFNWDLAIEAKSRFGLPIILAGGLTPENVGEAIAKVQPYAVDVASGVEAAPGRKDHARLRAFLQAARRADAALNR